jgi:hypothetical protein
LKSVDARDSGSTSGIEGELEQLFSLGPIGEGDEAAAISGLPRKTPNMREQDEVLIS